MDEHVKQYADTLYEGSQQESSKTARYALKEAARRTAAAAPSISNLSLSGIHVRHLVAIMSDHIERCMVARLDSYYSAYQESNSGAPSDLDFDLILRECQALRTRLIPQAEQNIRRLVQQYGGAALPISTRSMLEASSAHGHDRILSRWRQWKAKAQVEKRQPLAPRLDKQKDVLLPVFNRAEFDTDLAELSTAASESSPLSLAFMDLDKFKSINDGPGGHAAGDRALMAFADVVLGVCKSKGNAYRYGGDELCVLLGNHSLAEAHAIAERICHGVSEAEIAGLPRKLSTSIGVASFPESVDDASALCSSADAAMYESKRVGGNCVTPNRTLSSKPDSAVSGSRRPTKADIKKQLAAFMKEGKSIQNGIAYNNTASLQEKVAWEKRVEEYLLADLDDSYVVQFQIPSREANEHPQGIMLGMLPSWRDLTSRMWMLSDFISKLRD